MASADTITLQIAWGTKVLEPVKYSVETASRGRWWWKRMEYFVVSDFGRLGPFFKVSEVTDAMEILRGGWR